MLRRLGAIALVAVAGCAPAAAPTAPPTPSATSVAAPSPVTPSASAPSTVTPASPSAPPPHSAPAASATPNEEATVGPVPTESAAPAPLEPPPAPTAPAPSTAGGLSEADVPVIDGWQPTAKPGSPEEGYLGNGTWVHATSAAHSGRAAIALGCAELGPYPDPVAALEGTLSDEAGRAGIGLTLEFASPTDAGAYFGEWRRQAEACAGTMTEPLQATATTWLGRRHLETTWSEAVSVHGRTVRLLIVDDPDADLTGALTP